MSIYEQVMNPPQGKNGKVFYEVEFNSLSQLQLFLQENPKVNYIFSNQASLSTEDLEFYGEPLEKAIEYLIHGYNKDYQQFLHLRKEIQTALDIETPQRKYVKSHVGSRVHMPNYVANKPKYMLRLEPPQNLKFTTVHFNLSYPAYTCKEAIYNRGILTLNLIKILELHGYVVNLNAFDLSKVDDEYIYIHVNLKRKGQILDEKKCFFPFCGREFLRRDLFRVTESMNVRNPDWSMGYGMSVETDEMRDVLSIPKTDIVVSHPSSVGVHGRDIYDDANNFFQRLNLNKEIKIKQLKRK